MTQQLVLRAITRLNVGGPARQALMLTKALQPEYGTILVSGRSESTEGELSDDFIKVHHVPLVRQVRPLYDVRAFTDLRRLMAARRPALVHTHMAKAGALGRVAVRTLHQSIATVHTFHGHVLDEYFSKPVESAFLFAERALARTTDVLVAVSEEVKASLLNLEIGDEQKFRVINLGFDLTEFLDGKTPGALRRVLGVDEDLPLIGAVGRLVPIKDHETLLDAMLTLPEVHLAIVGDGELRAKLETTVHARGLSDRVHFTGWWPGDLSEVYADLDLAVLSSRNEGSPVALIEAHASGLAAVATDVGGVRSVVRDGISGLLVPPGDPSALATSIEELLRDEPKRRAMGQAGRAYVAERFTQERLVSDIRSLYRELIGR